MRERTWNMRNIAGWRSMFTLKNQKRGREAGLRKYERPGLQNE